MEVIFFFFSWLKITLKNFFQLRRSEGLCCTPPSLCPCVSLCRTSCTCVSRWMLCWERSCLVQRRQPSVWSRDLSSQQQSPGCAFTFLTSPANQEVGDATSFVRNALTRRFYEVHNVLCAVLPNYQSDFCSSNKCWNTDTSAWNISHGLRPVGFQNLPHLGVAEMHNEQGGQGTSGLKKNQKVLKKHTRSDCCTSFAHWVWLI